MSFAHQTKSKEDNTYLRLQTPYPNIGLVLLDNPARRNCLSYQILLDLRETFEKLGQNKKISAIVLAAEGSTFSAGHDLRELRSHRSDADGGKGFYSQTMQACSDLMKSMIACPLPIIAAVEGTATAAGCQLVATCDLAVAEEGAVFATPGVNIGLFCSTPMVALSRNISRKRAMEMLVLGDLITAPEAETYGLINRVVPKGKGRESALQLALKIASKSSTVVKLGKAAFYRQDEEPLEAAYADAARVMVENLLEQDCEEGIDAFLEKRKPEWSGTANS